MTRTTARSTKAIVAGGLAVALLAGAGGTFATWEATQEVTGDDITAGHLELAATKGTWSDRSGPIDDIASYRIVPGSRITYEVPVELSIEGDDLQAEFSTTLATAIPERIKDRASLTQNFTVGNEHGLLLEGTETATETLTPEHAGTYDVTVTLALDENASADWQRETFRLKDVTVQVSQITGS